VRSRSGAKPQPRRQARREAPNATAEAGPGKGHHEDSIHTSTSFSKEDILVPQVFKGQSPLGFLQLGYITDPLFIDFRRNQQIQVTSGVIPCASGIVEFTVTNRGN